VSHPTFDSWQDRVVYLLAEYKILIMGLLLGIIGLVVYYQPQAPDLPDWIPAVLAGWVLLGMPCYLTGLKIARWLHRRNWDTVFHINAVTGEREKYKVPPETWKNRENIDAAPNLVNDGDAYEVREMEWLEEVGALEVNGTWMGAAKDSELITAKAHMKRVHDSLLDKAATLAQLRGEWSDNAVTLQERLINTGAEARERGLMLDDTATTDTWKEMRGNIEEERDEILEASERDLAEDERQQTSDGYGQPEPTDPQTNGSQP